MVRLGQHHENPRYLWGLAFVAGFFIVGGQLALNAFTNNFYPSHVRATGAGWALGVGRFGSVLGPLFGAMLLAMHIAVPQIFFYCAIPAAWSVIQVRLPAPVPSADSERSDDANVTLDLSASTAKSHRQMRTL
ncbi:4-hydroxybenzoate transporter PcaK [Pseudomonas synxantha]|nr:4-hydroxybenzoate transporter PcaK [Pseudomonas synxantha]